MAFPEFPVFLQTAVGGGDQVVVRRAILLVGVCWFGVVSAAEQEFVRNEANDFVLKSDRGVPRIFRGGSVMSSRVFFGSFMHGGFPKSWESVPRQFGYALDCGVPFFETHGDLFWEGCDIKKTEALNRKRADAFFAAARGRPCWMIVRLLCNPPPWWMTAHPEARSEWNDSSQLTGWIAKHSLQTLASPVYQAEAEKAIRKTIEFYERAYPGRMAATISPGSTPRVAL